MSTEREIIKGILLHGLDIIEYCVIDPVDLERYRSKLQDEKLDYPIPKKEVDYTNWFIPNEYARIDIEQFLIDRCPEENRQRLMTELELFKKYDMIPVLKTMKYIVDTLRNNNIVWGVGRGSAVSSYVLFLIGVHKVDSIKYNLGIEEFLKENKNG